MMKNLPVRLKIATIYVLMTVFTLPLVVFYYQSAKGISSGQDEIYSQVLAGTRSVADMQAAALRQAAAARDTATGLGGAETTLDDAQAAYTKAQAALQELVEGNDGANALLAAARNTYESSFAPAVAAVAGQGTDPASLNAAGQELQLALNSLAENLDGQALEISQRGTARVRMLLLFSPGYILIYLLCTFILGRRITSKIAFPLRDLNKAAERIAVGDVEVEVNYRAKDEIGRLAEAFRTMLAGIQQQANILQVIAQGDYTAQIPVRGERDMVNRAIKTMLDNNNQLVSVIRESSIQVAAAAQQVSQGAQSLSSGSTQQAATVEQLSAVIHQIQSQSTANSQLANQAAQETEQSGVMMQQSVQSMDNMAAAMQAIDEGSRNIAKVIGVIDSIAFQTNILALNAAVEAARAGQHGKGFAVVADEVRNLATKSQKAAKETAALIEDSVKRVEEGNGIAASTRASLLAVAEIAESNAAKMAEINMASGQQDSAIREVNEGIGQLSSVIQLNSATAEESAASSQQLSAQAAELQHVVARFRLRNGFADAFLQEAPALKQAAPQATLPQAAGDEIIF